MNYQMLPEFIAISTLVGIFFSLLRRTPQTHLRYLFVGWLLILGHFLSALIASKSALGKELLDFTQIATLLLASVAFIWAARAWDGGGSRRFLGMVLAAAPSVVYFGYVLTSGTSADVLYVLSALGLLFSLRAADLGRARRYRVLDVAMLVAVYAGQVAVATLVSFDTSVSWLLACGYYGVAITFWRNSQKVTTGTVATTWAFVLWGSVFPIAEIMARVAPSVRVDPEVWNLPKFLAAAGTIFILLEDQLARNEQLALQDDLTGLPNRRLFEDRFAQSLSQARRSRQRVALFSLDVDRFKEVNDTRGHVAGDELLRLMASRFSSALRESDTLARTGGDEFGVVVSGVPDRGTAEAIAHALHASLALPIVVHNDPIRATVSVGIALYPDDGTEAIALKAFADREMYREKRAQAVTAGPVAH